MHLSPREQEKLLIVRYRVDLRIKLWKHVQSCLRFDTGHPWNGGDELIGQIALAAQAPVM